MPVVQMKDETLACRTHPLFAVYMVQLKGMSCRQTDLVLCCSQHEMDFEVVNHPLDLQCQGHFLHLRMPVHLICALKRDTHFVRPELIHIT